MKPKQKPTYNMWQNTGFMLRLAWKNCRSVPALCIAIALASAGKTVVQLLIAPGILSKVEPLPDFRAAHRHRPVQRSFVPPFGPGSLLSIKQFLWPD